MRDDRASLTCEPGGLGRDRTFDACAFNAALYLTELPIQKPISTMLTTHHSHTLHQRPWTGHWHIRPSPAQGGEPVLSRNCATALFANTVEIGRGCTRFTHQAIPTDPRNYFAGIGTTALAHCRVGPDTRHDTNLLKITCQCASMRLWHGLLAAQKAKNPVLLQETGLLVCKRELATRLLHPVGTNSQNHSQYGRRVWQLRSLTYTWTIHRSAAFSGMWTVHTDLTHAGPHRSRWGCV